MLPFWEVKKEKKSISIRSRTLTRRLKTERRAANSRRIPAVLKIQGSKKKKELFPLSGTVNPPPFTTYNSHFNISGEMCTTGNLSSLTQLLFIHIFVVCCCCSMSHNFNQAARNSWTHHSCVLIRVCAARRPPTLQASAELQTRSKLVCDLLLRDGGRMRAGDAVCLVFILVTWHLLFILVTWHLFFCPSWRGVLSSVVFLLIRCEVKGQVQIVKPSEANS